MTDSCPFCQTIEEGRVDAFTGHAAAFPDAYPVSPGHSLVVPRRHVAGLFELSMEELDEVWQLVQEMRSDLAADRAPDGFTVGVNDGAAAGQTVPHAHVHVIPRWSGDRADPRGGVRWVLPERAPYWDDES